VKEETGAGKARASWVIRFDAWVRKSVRWNRVDKPVANKCGVPAEFVTGVTFPSLTLTGLSRDMKEKKPTCAQSVGSIKMGVWTGVRY